MPYKHAIWDWNGTLLNDTWLCVEVLNSLLAGVACAPITTKDYRENFGFQSYTSMNTLASTPMWILSSKLAVVYRRLREALVYECTCIGRA